MKDLKSLPLETVNFSIKGKNETHKGTATVFHPITSGINAAIEYFGFENSNLVKKNCIGSTNVDGKTYKIWENYIDSGSDDYFYFAVEIIN
jgi:hypothetical protein